MWGGGHKKLTPVLRGVQKVLELRFSHFVAPVISDQFLTNVTAISLTTVLRERCFPLSERNSTPTLVISRIWQDERGVTMFPNLPRSNDSATLENSY